MPILMNDAVHWSTVQFREVCPNDAEILSNRPLLRDADRPRLCVEHELASPLCLIRVGQSSSEPLANGRKENCTQQSRQARITYGLGSWTSNTSNTKRLPPPKASSVVRCEFYTHQTC